MADPRLHDVLEFLRALAATEEGASFWPLRAWVERHNLYIDDLEDVRAFRVMAAEAARLLAKVIEHG